MKRVPTFREFLAPLPLAAVVLMAVNDHWLKPAFHNIWTGKLSDLAICFFLPLLISAGLEACTRWTLPRRLLVGVAMTALLFVPLKLSQPAADLFCAVLGSIGRPLGFHQFRAVADPTDLIALPFLALAVASALHLSASRCPNPNEAPKEV